VWVLKTWLLKRLGFCWLISVVAIAGCSAPGPELVYLPDQPQPPPAANLPVDLRIKNYIGTDQDGDRGGSCVHVTTRMNFRAAGDYDLDLVWFENATRGYEGPETAGRLLDKLNRQGILFAATEDGEVELLETASREGRWAIIFYYPSHAIAFCGFDTIDGREVALLLDNNFPESYIVVEKQLFLDSWIHAYGGFACVPWITQVVPRTYPRSYER
jgi:hypothetical protein